MHGRLTAGREAVFRVPIVAVPCSSAQPGPKRGATAEHAEHAHTRSKRKRSAKHLFSSRIYEVRARVSPQFGCEERLYIEQKHLLQKKVSTPPRVYFKPWWGTGRLRARRPAPAADVGYFCGCGGGGGHGGGGCGTWGVGRGEDITQTRRG